MRPCQKVVQNIKRFCRPFRKETKICDRQDCQREPGPNQIPAPPCRSTCLRPGNNIEAKVSNCVRVAKHSAVKPPLTKITAFKGKNRFKSAEEAKAELLLYF